MRDQIVLGEANKPPIITPDTPKAEIDAIAHKDNAVETVRELARHLFDAANSRVAASPELEELHREEAGFAQERRRRVDQQQRTEPETISVIEKEKTTKPAGWTRFSGWLALFSMLVLLLPMPFVIAQGIAQSYIFDFISDDWTLGIPFGLAALCSIFGSGLLRLTLSHNKQIGYDRTVSIATLFALTAWAVTFALTFLAPDTSGSGFASGREDAALHYFYGAQILLECTAGLGLAALAERCFTAGHRIKTILNETLGELDFCALVAHENHIEQACQVAGFNDHRIRLEAAKEAFVLRCLAYLEHAKTRRAAAIAQAVADFSTTHQE